MVTVVADHHHECHQGTKIHTSAGRCNSIRLSRDQQRRQIRRFLQKEIDFISSRQFCEKHAEREILQGEVAELLGSHPATSSSLSPSMPAHLARLCEVNVLSPDEERNLFRALNYLKFRANALRSRLDPDALI
ncbi:MAG: hypothetical protein R3C10_26065 [Pirellulales bacterium]